jgi:hypothetical protein
MHVRRVANQLADLFARHGVAVEVDATVTGRTRTSYRLPLVLRTAEGPVLVDGDLEAASLDDGTVLRMYLTAVDCGARALLLHSGTVPDAARAFCGDKVTLWPQADAVALLGQSLWNAALGAPLPALPLTLPGPAAAPIVVVAPAPEPAKASAAPAPEPAAEVLAGTETIPPSPPTGAPAEPYIDLEAAPSATPAMDLETGVDVVVTTLPTDAADELASAEPLVAEMPPPPVELPPAFRPLPEGRLAPRPEDAGAEHAAAVAEVEANGLQMPPAFRGEPTQQALPVPDGSRGLLPARITLEEARAKVGDRLFGIEEWELILQPVHLFDYSVDVLRAGSLAADTTHGLLQVNGTDRRVTAVPAGAIDPPARVFAAPDLTVMDKVLRVSPERAAGVAREWATAQHGKTVHVNLAGVDDAFDLVERRTVGPTSGQVHLNPLGIWHRPFWRLWGSNGHVDLDAVEGSVIEADLKDSNPDFLLVD